MEADPVSGVRHRVELKRLSQAFFNATYLSRSAWVISSSPGFCHSPGGYSSIGHFYFAPFGRRDPSAALFDIRKQILIWFTQRREKENRPCRSCCDL